MKNPISEVTAVPSSAIASCLKVKPLSCAINSIVRKRVNLLRIILVVSLLLSLSLFFTARAQEFIPLWPADKMPNSKGLPLEHKEERQRITQVKTPGIYAFFTSNEDNLGSAVLICPPGGYQKLTYNLAGFQWAKWFNTMGVNAFVLIHRLPNSPDLIEREKGPVQDAQRALKIIRSRATAWNIDTSKVGIVGASAGGHLASTLGTHFEDFSLIGDSIDHYSVRPDFMVLISAVITMGDYAHKGSVEAFLGADAGKEKRDYYSNEKQVTKQTPPAFLVHARDDNTVPVQNSIQFYNAMLDKGVDGSLHIFPYGRHSISLRNESGMLNLWTALCENWLNEMGFLKQQ